MRLESAIVIHRRADEVWKFLTEPANLPKWDHGVASVEFRDPTAPEGVGYEFTTVGHRGPDLGRMTYRVSEVDAEARDCRLELTSRTGNARFFQSAGWRMRVEEVPEGSRVLCSAEFRMRRRYWMLAPVLYWMKAMDRDLVGLKGVLEDG